MSTSREEQKTDRHPCEHRLEC